MRTRQLLPLERQALLTRGWLTTQSTDFSNALLEVAQRREFQAGQTIFSEGDEIDGLDGLASGSLGLYSAPSENPEVLIHVAMPGEWGGGGPLKRISTLVARSDVTIASVSRKSLRDMEAEFSDLRLRLETKASIYIDFFRVLYADNSGKDIDARIRAAIRRLLGEPFVPGFERLCDPVDIPVTRDEIAELAGLSRNAVGPTLRELQRSGAISLGYRKVTVMDRSLLHGSACSER
jgi:CRP/FNR family transcriptional regulator